MASNTGTSDSKVLLDVGLNLDTALQDVSKLKSALESVSTSLKGTKIGEQFAKGFSGIKNWEVMQQYAKNIGKEIKTAASETKKLGDETEKTKKSFSDLGSVMNDAVEGLGKRISIYFSYKAINLVTSSFSELLSTTVNLQKEFANIQAITAATDKEMASLEKTIFAVGTSTRFSNEEIAKATVTLGQAGLSAKQIEEALSSVVKLASATGTDLATVVSVVTSALSIWNLSADQAGRVADTLTTAVNRTKAEIQTIANGMQYAGAAAADMGISFEETVAVMTAVTNAGLKARAVVGTGMRAVLTELVSPGDKLQKVFKKLGISLEDVDIEGQGLVKTLQTLKDAGLGATEAFQGFDRRAASFYLAAVSQLDTINSLREAFIQEGAVLKANATQMNTVSAQWRALTNTFEEIISKGLKPLMEALTQVLKLFNDLLKVPFAGEMTKIATATSLFYLAVKPLYALITKLTTGLKTFGATIGTVTTATKASTVAVNTFKLTLGTLVPLLTAVGFAASLLWETFHEGEKTLEDMRGEYDESGQRVSSLTEAFTELTNKQKLYRNDSGALALRIQELNKQFNLQGEELISLSSSYDEVLERMTRMRLEAQTQRVEQGGKIAESLRSGVGEKRTFTEKIGDFFRDFTGKETIEQVYNGFFDYVYKAAGSEANLRDIKDRIERLATSKESKETMLEIFSDAVETYKMDSAVDLERNLKALNDELVGLQVEFTKELYDVLENAKLDVKLDLGEKDINIKETFERLNNWAEQFEIPKSVGISSGLGGGMSKTPLLTRLKDFEKQLKELDPLGTSEQSKIISELKTEYSKVVSDILYGQVENLSKRVNQEYTLASESARIVTKLLNTKWGVGDDLIQSAIELRDKLAEKIENKKQIELRKLEEEFGKDSEAYRSGAELINLKYVAEEAKATKDLSKAIWEATNRFDDLAASLKETYAALKEVENRYQQELADANKPLNLLSAQQQALASRNMGGSNVLTNTLAYDQEKLTLEVNKQKLKIEERRYEALQNQMGALVHQKDYLQSMLDEEKARLETYENSEKNLYKIEESQERINTLTSQLNSLESQRLTWSNKIRESEKQITEEKEKQALLSGQAVRTPEEGIAKGITSATHSLGESIGVYKEVNATLAQITSDGITKFTDGFGEMVSSVIVDNQNLWDSFRTTFSDILKEWASFLAQMAVKVAAYQALMSAMENYSGFFNLGKSDSSKSDSGSSSGSGFGFSLGSFSNISSLFTDAFSAFGFASGGSVKGGIPNRDSVYTKLMPGEYVLKKSAASYLGEDFLNGLNNNAQQTLAEVTPTVRVQEEGSSSVVNVWVVADQDSAQVGPNDIITAISKDIISGGQTRRLIQTIVNGKKL